MPTIFWIDPAILVKRRLERRVSSKRKGFSNHYLQWYSKTVCPYLFWEGRWQRGHSCWASSSQPSPMLSSGAPSQGCGAPVHWGRLDLKPPELFLKVSLANGGSFNGYGSCRTPTGSRVSCSRRSWGSSRDYDPASAITSGAWGSVIRRYRTAPWNQNVMSLFIRVFPSILRQLLLQWTPALA